MTSSAATAATTPSNDLARQLAQIGLRAISENLDDFIARATKARWSPRVILEDIAQVESRDRVRRSLERRLHASGIRSFKPMADFDWTWPKKIDREVIERALTLDFVKEARNLVLLGPNGIGKTMIAKNVCHLAVLGGHSVLFRSAADIIQDLQCESPDLRRRKIRRYGYPGLLCIDEVGYLSFDDKAADLLYEVINRRYEHRSVVITTNRAFRDWNEVFPNAACITTLVDRLVHHADVTLIEGESYRARESELENRARRKKR